VTEDTKLAWLLHYCGQGMRLLPVYEITPEGRCACGKNDCQPANWGKHPRLNDWPNKASADPAQVSAWHRQWPSANWAWALDRHFVVDVDPRNGGPKPDEFDQIWEDAHGFTLPSTLAQSTGGGGLHLVYEQPNGTEIRNGKLNGRGVEVKGVGGYILVAPSNHRSGGTYVWSGAWVAPTPAPAELVALVRSGRTKPYDAGAVEQDHESLDFDAWLKQGPEIPPDEQHAHLIQGLGWMRQRMYTQESALRLAWQVAERYPTGRPDDPWTIEHVAGQLVDVWKRYGTTLAPEVLELGRKAAGLQTQDPVFDQQLGQRVTQLRVSAAAQQILEAEQLAAARGPRPKRRASEYALVEPPPAILDRILAAEVNLLGGPAEAGKSLLLRDWALAVASGQPWRGYPVVERRKVLIVLSEGTHDFAERWVDQPYWQEAADDIFILDEPVDLVHGDDVDWLLKEYADERPGLVGFDVVYGMGMSDDNGVKDVLPVLTAMKKISARWKAATVALGHPGHNGDRRFRGSSSWRQLAAVEFHMAENLLTCEKSKIANKHELSAAYTAAYPGLTWPSKADQIREVSERAAQVQRDVEERPGDSISERARRLAPRWNVSIDHARKLIRAVRPDVEEAQ
jgi:hypothetical protein